MPAGDTADTFILQDYATSLEQKGEGRKLSTLIDIAMEFIEPYGDVRREPRVLNVSPILKDNKERSRSSVCSACAACGIDATLSLCANRALCMPCSTLESAGELILLIRMHSLVGSGMQHDHEGKWPGRSS